MRHKRYRLPGVTLPVSFLTVTLLFLLLAMPGCATTQTTPQPHVDLSTASPSTRVAIAPVAFYQKTEQGLVPVDADQNLAIVIVRTLEEYLQEKGYAGFLAREQPNLITADEQRFLLQLDLVPLLDSLNLRQGFPADATAPAFNNVTWLLFPVISAAPGTVWERLLSHPGTLNVTLGAILINAHTGQVAWQHTMPLMGNYKAIDLQLRGFRWGHGAMWEVLETFPSDLKVRSSDT